MLGTVALALTLTQSDPPTVATLDARLRAARTPEARLALADSIRRWFGGPDRMVSAWKSDGTDVVWAVQTPERPTLVVAGRPRSRVAVKRIEGTDVWTLRSRMGDGEGEFYEIRAGSKIVGKGFVEAYVPEPETKFDPSVPKGTLTAKGRWESQIFSGTRRDWWLYVPAGLAATEEAAVMVFQDGQGSKDWVPNVLDNVIAKGWMPKTVGVFVPPGAFADGRSNRSFEYDTLSDAYVRFITEEILPEVEKSVRLSKDPAKRAISGASSGGICAFTAAWERPDQFGKVLSTIGSFTNIASGPTKRAGGHNYPAIIRKSDARPIRVLLQDGANDLDNEHGNWPLANQTMAAALAFKGYDYTFLYGRGQHNERYARAHFPSMLRWLWRP